MGIFQLDENHLHESLAA